MRAMPAGICEPGDAAPSEARGVGFCGKLPSHGDFVRRRLPEPFVRGWDDWLDAAMAASRSELGDGWQESYLNCPIWRFAASAGCCGDQPFTGVLMPSLDRIGRHHPLAIVAMLDRHRSPVGVALAADAWFRHIEALALSALEPDFDFAQFDRTLAAAAQPGGNAVVPFATGYRCAGRMSGLGDAAAMLLAHCGEQVGLRYSLWWTVDRQERYEFCCCFDGLPAAAAFATLLRPQAADDETAASGVSM
jgi:type VI secretion system protein ImpM